MSNDWAETAARPRITGVDPATGLDAEAVRAFLLDNPGFLMDDPVFMRAFLDRSADVMGGNVSSLSAAMVARAEQTVRAVSASREDMIEAAKANMIVLEQIRAAVLTVLEADSPFELAELVCGDLADLMRVDSAFVALEGAEEDGDGLADLPRGAVDALTGGAVALRPADERIADMHTLGVDVASEAIAPFYLSDGREGALVFGAEDPFRFSPEQGGDMLAFLAVVVGRHLDRLRRSGGRRRR